MLTAIVRNNKNVENIIVIFMTLSFRKDLTLI